MRRGKCMTKPLVGNDTSFRKLGALEIERLVKELNASDEAVY